MQKAELSTTILWEVRHLSSNYTQHWSRRHQSDQLCATWTKPAIQFQRFVLRNRDKQTLIRQNRRENEIHSQLSTQLSMQLINSTFNIIALNIVGTLCTILQIKKTLDSKKYLKCHYATSATRDLQEPSQNQNW